MKKKIGRGKFNESNVQEPAKAAAAEPLTEAEAIRKYLDSLPVVEVTSVEVLDEACRQPIKIEFPYAEKMWHMTGRTLTPAEEDRVNLILEQAMPDILPPAEGSTEIRYDLRSQDYLAKKQKYKEQARALALWLAYPFFGTNEKVKLAAPAGKPNLDLLAQVMRTFFTAEIQELMMQKAVGRNELWKKVNFF